ncbi:hypothetical protein Dvina_30905 [Dactylosporangium vinaceum]|uniref:Uncharacterized protein n=1 Tax=Dactylosporangium vinaceum TaxID=53362 RepID=A0ABV5MKM3_9ACTN|nr:hypothetical protein [Dactylosporangium vinaceum]UAB92727.1 hypothetical protein Dvina_30905 [Dactylosporangium vinaceum]
MTLPDSPDAELHARLWPSARGFAPGSGEATYVQLHELLLGLAGRLPDSDVISLRDSVVTDPFGTPGGIAFAALRAHVPLTRPEVNAIVEISRALRVPGGDPPQLDKLILTDTVTDGGHRFGARPGVAQDFTDQSAAIAFMYEKGAQRMWRAWRADPDGPRRIFLATVAPGTAAWRLTRIMQRDLAQTRAIRVEEAADVVPTVEIFFPDWEPAPYHRNALETAELLWSREGGRTAK